MKQIKNSTGQPQFDILAYVMVDSLILFRSSADGERIFSFVIKTFCHSTSTKTLNSLSLPKVSLSAKGTTYSWRKHSSTFLLPIKNS